MNTNCEVHIISEWKYGRVSALENIEVFHIIFYVKCGNKKLYFIVFKEGDKYAIVETTTPINTRGREELQMKIHGRDFSAMNKKYGEFYKGVSEQKLQTMNLFNESHFSTTLEDEQLRSEISYEIFRQQVAEQLIRLELEALEKTKQKEVSNETKIKKEIKPLTLGM